MNTQITVIVEEYGRKPVELGTYLGPIPQPPHERIQVKDTVYRVLTVTYKVNLTDTSFGGGGLTGVDVTVEEWRGEGFQPA